MTGSGWLEMAAAFAAFLALHSVPARPPMRTRLVRALGETGYLTLYSLLSLLALGWLIAAAGRAPYVELWTFAPWQTWIPNLAMPAACLLAAFGAGASNPLSFGGRAPHGFEPDRPGIAGITRHPLLWALALWSGSHLVPNGDLAHVLLFGGFTAFALAGMWAIDMRFKRTLGADEWRRLAARTSIVPFAAVFSGRWRPSGVNIDAELVMRLLGAAALYTILLSLHEPTIGVAPFPAWPP
jgi:uncharacterized membrane protein